MLKKILKLFRKPAPNREVREQSSVPEKMPDELRVYTSDFAARLYSWKGPVGHA